MPIPDSAAVHRAVEAVYRRPEYNPQEQVSIWDRMWDTLGRGLRWLVEQLDSVRALRFTSPILFYIIVAWLAIAAIAILAHLVWTAVSATRADPGLRTEKAARARATRPRGVDDWDEEARRLAAEGRLREASIALYQALLLRL
ncbi:MAG TPA: hypothetical protein VF665_08250, partial [Longimicrobium sp.]|uniref:hypothetical protein n=1 Tax=Longimicrobium sp. TaxID=2029185 RepID=UPI002ED7C920